MSAKKEFITIENIVSAILLEIGDENNRQYYVRAFQWALDEYRRIMVHHSSFYTEKKLQLDTSLYYADYPPGMVKMLSVGVYRNGKFWPFTKEPNLSMYPVDAADDIWEEGDNEDSLIPDRGYGFSARSANIGYWADDPQECRIFVRNYTWDSMNANYSNTTDQLTGKVIARYKTTGVESDKDLCVPYEYRELLIALVTYRLMQKNIPVEPMIDRLNRMQMRIGELTEEFHELQHGVTNLWEVKDAIYSSLNTVPRR